MCGGSGEGSGEGSGVRGAAHPMVPLHHRIELIFSSISSDWDGAGGDQARPRPRGGERAQHLEKVKLGLVRLKLSQKAVLRLQRGQAARPGAASKAASGEGAPSLWPAALRPGRAAGRLETAAAHRAWLARKRQSARLGPRWRGNPPSRQNQAPKANPLRGRRRANERISAVRGVVATAGARCDRP